MKNTPSSISDEDDYSSSHMPYCWWRSTSKFEECARLNLALPDISSLTPQLKVLRELERLALLSHDGGLHELRYKLQMYKSGDFWVPTGGLKKEEMDIPPVITILLVGFSSSGKSSLVNLMYSVLGRTGLVPFVQTSSGNAKNYTTMYLEEHNVMRSMQSGFCVYDSRGFNYERIGEGLEELSNWMTDGVHHNQLCWRSGDSLNLLNDDTDGRSSSKFAIRKVNCAMVVINMAEFFLAFQACDTKQLEATKELFCSPVLRKCNENPILILTHGDLLTSQERLDTRIKLCELLDIAEANGVYEIVCITEHGFLAEETDPITAYSVAEAVYRALLISDRGHLPKDNIQDWTVYIISMTLTYLGMLFAYFARIFIALGQRDKRLRRR